MEEFDKRYIWGYTVGASMLGLGLFVLVPGMDDYNGGMIFFGVWYAVAGFGLLRKTFYGVMLFYMAVLYGCWTLLQASTWAGDLGWHILLLIWLGLPAIFCYRRFERIASERLQRWPEWMFPKRFRSQTRNLSDTERQKVLEHMRERGKAKEAGQK